MFFTRTRHDEEWLSWDVFAETCRWSKMIAPTFGPKTNSAFTFLDIRPASPRFWSYESARFSWEDLVHWDRPLRSHCILFRLRSLDPFCNRDTSSCRTEREPEKPPPFWQPIFLTGYLFQHRYYLSWPYLRCYLAATTSCGQPRWSTDTSY